MRLMVEKKQITETFKQLVQINSLSLEEREMADILKVELQNLGFEVDEDNTGDKINGNAGNVIAELAGDESLPSLLLSAHMDRVEPGINIKPVIKNGYLKSKGDTILAADDVAGITGILEALKIVKDKNIPHGKIKVIFTVAEELGLQGAKNLDPIHYQDLDLGVVYDAEGKVGNIIYTGPTKAKFNAVIRGQASHAGISPNKGVNAIKISSLSISAMNLGQIDNDTTANIGVIRGGVARNIVPDLVELEGEARSQKNTKLKQQINHMKGIINKYVNKYKGEVDFNIEVLYHNFSLDLDSDIINILNKAAEKIGLEVDFLESCGGNDANIFNNQGLPTANLGIGMENAHSKIEKIKIKYLQQLVEYTVSIIKTCSEWS